MVRPKIEWRLSNLTLKEAVTATMLATIKVVAYRWRGLPESITTNLRALILARMTRKKTKISQHKVARVLLCEILVRCWSTVAISYVVVIDQPLVAMVLFRTKVNGITPAVKK